MTQTKTSKRALLTSALSLLLCCTMLIGTTWAWFTDSVTSAGNKIQSGTLQVDLLVKGGNTGYPNYTSVKANKAPIFDYELWEPGYTLVTNAKVVNLGSLALKYTLKFVSADDIASQKLAEVIDVFYAPSEVSGIDSRTALNEKIADKTLKPLGTLKDVFTQGEAVVMNDNLEPNGEGKNYEDFATIVLKMKEEAGNEYQNQTISAFDIQLLATQWTYENDTFNNQYDVNANGMPDHPEWADLKANKTVPQAESGDTVIDAAPGVKVTVPENTSTDDLTVTVSPTSAPATVEIADTQDSVSYEVNVTGAAEGTLIKVELQTVAGKTGVVVKHNGTDMTAVAADNTTNEGYYYDSTTGIVTIWTKTFSPFTILFDKPGSLSVGTLDEFNAALADENVKTILLTSDLTTSNIVEIVRDVTIDGGNNTISTTARRAVWIDTDNVTLTLKNLKIDGNNKTERGVQVNNGQEDDFYDATIVIDNCEIKNMTYYAINFCSCTTVNMTLTNSTVQGWAAINAYGTGNVIKVDNCVLEGLNNKGVDAWNDFATICLEGDTTGQTDAHSSDYQITISNSTIKALQTTGNVQTILGYNDNAKNSSVSFGNCTFDIGEGCYFGYDKGSTETPNSLFINGSKFNMPHNEYFNIS